MHAQCVKRDLIHRKLLNDVHDLRCAVVFRYVYNVFTGFVIEEFQKFNATYNSNV
jgi:hypothetical protein